MKEKESKIRKKKKKIKVSPRTYTLFHKG